MAKKEREGRDEGGVEEGSITNSQHSGLLSPENRPMEGSFL